MSHSSEISMPRLENIVATLVEHRKLVIIPAVAALALSVFYVFFVKSDTYSARQSIIVRDDLLGQSFKPGRFDSLDSMKSAQETILEIARKPQVVRNALRRIGPASTSLFGVSDNWPSDSLIEDVQGSIEISAPNGAEFGHTEVIVLSAKAGTRDRARAFLLALLDEIEVKTNEVRLLRLKSIEQELLQIRDAAGHSLADSSSRLRVIEKEVGADLSTLRSLSDPQGGGDTLSQSLLQIRLEKRQAGSELDSATYLRKTLESAWNDPNSILATSDELFRFQPALNRLKQELIQAQSAYAKSVGRYEKAHPVVMDNGDRVKSMHRQIYEELGSAQRGLDSRIVSLEKRVGKLTALEKDIEQRLNALSARRVDYLRLDAEVQKKTQVFNEAQAELSKIQRLGKADGLAGLLTRVDEPQVATRADGLGKKAIILAGGMAGLLIGLGIVLLIAGGEQTDAAPARPVASSHVANAEARLNKMAAMPSTSPRPHVDSSQEQPPKPWPMAGAETNAAASVRENIPSPAPQPAQAPNAAAPSFANQPAQPTPIRPRPAQQSAETAAVQQPPSQPVTPAMQTNRGTGDSSGVPTAASIMAAIEAQKAAGNDGVRIVQPERTKQPVAAETRKPSTPNVEIKPRQTIGSDSSKSIELQRRPAAEQPTSRRASNPFLNSGVVAVATAPAAREISETIVQPIKPAPTADDLDAAKQKSASTVPIPDQIRQLSESISAFASPIARTSDPV